MRRSVREFISIANSIFDFPEPIYEFGSLQVEGQEMANLRPLFPCKKFIGCDMRPGMGVDRVEDIHATSLSGKTAGTVILADTLEHVRNPDIVIKEAYRILFDRGVLVMTSVMDFPIHNHPYDYWRFTPQIFLQMVEAFQAKIIGYQGYSLFPHTIFGIALKRTHDTIKAQFNELSARARVELKAEPGPSRKKQLLAEQLLKWRLVNHHHFLADMIKRYAETHNLHFELFEAMNQKSHDG